MNDTIIRPARAEEIQALESLIAASTRALSVEDNTPEEIESSIRYIFGVDTELVGDQTYFVVEKEDRIAACGGWSRRRTLFGADKFAGRESGLLDPETEPAKIRAFFVHPQFARQGIGKLLIQHCEAEAKRHGFREAELMATLPGVEFYRKCGYIPGAMVHYPVEDGTTVRFVPMKKDITC